MPNTACTTERTRSRTKRVWEPDERVTLSQAARIAPGGVSPNCVWRWCRRGVLSRMGERVRLEHVRVGGKLYTTPRWIEAFGQRLAEADAAYFETADDEPQREPAPKPATRARRRRRRVMTDQQEAERRARVRAELEEEGL